MKALIRISDLEVLTVADDDANFAMDLLNPNIELPIPSEMDSSCLAAEMSGQEIILVEDSAKLQARRNAKLEQLRRLREEKLKKVDLMINALSLGIRADLTAIRDYRQALLDITADYKKVNGDAKVAIDTVDLEAASIWPEEI